jgi:hypothetical protein
VKLLRLIRTALLLLQTGGTWADGEEWTNEDAAHLASFLRTDTGEKVARRLRNSALAFNASAVQRSEPWRNGQAAGYMLAVADIQTLSAEGALRDAQTSEDDAQGAATDLAHLAP